MLGFLAAVMAILLGFSNTAPFRQYRNRRFLPLFFFVYGYCLLTLIATFLFAVLILAASGSQIFMYGALALSVNSLVQVALIGCVIMNICRRAISG